MGDCFLCSYSGGFRWYYLVLVVIPLFLLSMFLARRRRNQMKMRGLSCAQFCHNFHVLRDGIRALVVRATSALSECEAGILFLILI